MTEKNKPSQFILFGCWNNLNEGKGRKKKK